MLLFLKWRDAIRLMMSFAIWGVFGLATAADPAAGYPSRPIRFVASTTAGGGNDILPRLLGMHMAANWNQQVIVDLRPGAAAIAGTQFAAHAVPDGYTLIVISNTYSLNLSLYEKLPYDTLKDLDRVSLFAVAPLVLVAHPTVPAQSLPEVIRLVQEKPAQIDYFGVLVTGGTPRSIIAKLHHEIRRIIALPVVKAQFDDLGVEPVDYGPEQFTAFVKADISKWAKIFAESRIKTTSIQ